MVLEFQSIYGFYSYQFLASFRRQTVFHQQDFAFLKFSFNKSSTGSTGLYYFVTSSVSFKSVTRFPDSTSEALAEDDLSFPDIDVSVSGPKTAEICCLCCRSIDEGRKLKYLKRSRMESEEKEIKKNEIVGDISEKKKPESEDLSVLNDECEQKVVVTGKYVEEAKYTTLKSFVGMFDMGFEEPLLVLSMSDSKISSKSVAIALVILRFMLRSRRGFSLANG